MPQEQMKFANITHISQDEQKLGHTIMNILLSINFNICFVCSKEPCHLDN